MSRPVDAVEGKRGKFSGNGGNRGKFWPLLEYMVSLTDLVVLRADISPVWKKIVLKSLTSRGHNFLQKSI